MSHKSVVYNFFATRDDITSVLNGVEAAAKVRYFECGLFASSERPPIETLASLPSLGRAIEGEATLQPTYLVVGVNSELTVREVPQRRGGAKYAVDQMGNPESIVLRPGGQFEQLALISGMLGTVHKNEASQALLNVFAEEFKKEFRKVNAYLVGPEAMTLLRSGFRLTQSIRASEELDLHV